MVCLLCKVGMVRMAYMLGSICMVGVVIMFHVSGVCGIYDRYEQVSYVGSPYSAGKIC